MKNWGIRTRVLLLAFFPAISVALALAGYIPYRMSADFERDQLNYGFGLSRQLAAVSGFSVYSGDAETLYRMALAALDEKFVTAVTFLDRAGQPLASSAPRIASITHLPADSQPMLLDSDDNRMLFAASITLPRYDADDPFLPEPGASTRAHQNTARGASIGWVMLEISRAPAKQRKREIMFFTVLATFAALLLGGLLALALGRQVTRPILRLEQAVSRIQAGQLDARVPADSGGDLQRLEVGVNAMAVALSENRDFLEARIQSATHQLEAKISEAERSTVAKSRFLAAASHDLRQPLHALSLFSADLRRAAETTDQTKLAAQISDSVHGASELLDSLLDISRLDVAGVTVSPEILPLAAIFERLAAGFTRSAADKKLRLHCRTTAYAVCTDRALLERLLGNLVANAIHYTECGSILVAARKRGDRICIEIRDSGIGIPVEHHEAVFEEFFQVQNTARTQGQGLGLGLAIVKRLARILDVSVALHSTPGRGSVFTVTLPLAVLPTDAHASLPRHLPAPAQAPLTAAQPAFLLLLPPATAALTEAAALALGWGFKSTWAISFEAAAQQAKQQGMLLIGPAEAYPAALLDEIIAENTGATPSLIVLDYLGGEPAQRHCLPAPLRPAKLRALLNHLLSVKA